MHEVKQCRKNNNKRKFRNSHETMLFLLSINKFGTEFKYKWTQKVDDIGNLNLQSLYVTVLSFPNPYINNDIYIAFFIGT